MVMQGAHNTIYVKTNSKQPVNVYYVSITGDVNMDGTLTLTVQ